jgi:hypothetical protein
LAVTFAEFRDRRKIQDIEHFTRQPLPTEVIAGLEPSQRSERPRGFDDSRRGAPPRGRGRPLGGGGGGGGGYRDGFAGARDSAPREGGFRDAGPRDSAPRDFAPRDGAPRSNAGRDFAPRDVFAPRGAAPHKATAHKGAPSKSFKPKSR